MLVKLILILILAFALAIFALQNSQPVRIQFLKWVSKDISLSIIILISFCVGVFLTIFSSLGKELKLRRMLRKKEEEIKNLRKT